MYLCDVGYLFPIFPLSLIRFYFFYIYFITVFVISLLSSLLGEQRHRHKVQKFIVFVSTVHLHIVFVYFLSSRVLLYCLLFCFGQIILIYLLGTTRRTKHKINVRGKFMNRILNCDLVLLLLLSVLFSLFHFFLLNSKLLLFHSA